MVARVVDVGEDRQNRFHAEGLLKQETLLRIHVSGLGKRLFLCAIRLRLTQGEHGLVEIYSRNYPRNCVKKPIPRSS